jgi:plastocyanin
MWINSRRVLFLVAVAALPLAACGDDDDNGGDAGGDGGEVPEGTIAVAALDSLAFDPEDITAAAGEITFVLTNDGSLPHTLVIEDHEDAMKLSVGGSDEGSIELEAGTYAFYCDVAGHRAGGMEGTLTVE